jgi:hypothetical protein
MNYDYYTEITSEEFFEIIVNLKAINDVSFEETYYFVGRKLIGITYFSFAKGQDVYYIRKEILKEYKENKCKQEEI